MTHAYLHISTDSRTCAAQIRIPRSVRFLCLLSCCLQSGGFFFRLWAFYFCTSAAFLHIYKQQTVALPLWSLHKREGGVLSWVAQLKIWIFLHFSPLILTLCQPYCYPSSFSPTRSASHSLIPFLLPSFFSSLSSGYQHCVPAEGTDCSGSIWRAFWAPVW